VIIDRTAWDFVPSHLLQTERLGTELQIVVPPLPAWATLILNGVRGIAAEFDYISPADQAEVFGPQREPTLDPHVMSYFLGALVYTLVEHVPLHRVDVLLKDLLDMNQGTLAWAVAIVFQG
jgi:hypothetical protein